MTKAMILRCLRSRVNYSQKTKNMSNIFDKIFLRIIGSQRRKSLMEKRSAEEYVEWMNRGKPSPPPHIVKQLVVKKAQKDAGFSTLVETGTYYGDMIYAQLDNFSRIYSIELSERLYRKAKRRFKKNESVTLLHGDSSEVLREIVPTFKEPILFWLDGHYSGGITAQGKLDTPIWEELTTILQSGVRHMILIDDARCFEEKRKDYPSIEELKSLILSVYPQSHIVVKDDVVRIKLIGE